MITTIFILQTRYQLLIAGSSGWNNYRHQADVMALSTLLHSNSSNIVTTMMKNDIVNHEDNPYPGKLFNTLKTSDNYNIYNKDYINSSIITLDNMKDLMKNFNFTHDDIITIYYNDHGAPGLLCSPYNNDPSNREFFADDINDYLKELSTTGAKILFIIESCYSGSVAKYISLPNVLTIAAANSIESSYAAKFSEDLSTFVSNVFTLNLINYINDPRNGDKTLLDLVNYLCANTLRSTVSMYGDRYHTQSLIGYKLNTIFGTLEPIPRDNEYLDNAELFNINEQAVRTQNIDLMRYHQHTLNYDMLKEYIHLLKQRQRHQKLFKNILSNISASLRLAGAFDNYYDSSLFKPLMYDKRDFNMKSHALNDKFQSMPEEIIFQDFTCWKQSIRSYKHYCGIIDDAELDQLLPSLARICYHYPNQTDIITLNIRRECLAYY